MGESLFFLVLGSVIALAISSLPRFLYKDHPTVRRLRSLLQQSDSPTFLIIIILGSIVLAGILILMIRIITIIISGRYGNPWTNDALLYSEFIKESNQQIFIGLVIGALLAKQVRTYSESNLADGQKKIRHRINITIVVLFVFALLLPYLDRMIPNTTSIEFSQIGKITFDARQASPTQSSLIVGPGGSTSADYKASDVADAMRTIASVSRNATPAMCQGMLQRDEKYVNIVNSNSSFRNSLAFRPQQPNVKRAAEADEAFFAAIKSTHSCLRAYADIYSDYRLLLIDIMPLIRVFTSIVGQNGEVDRSSDLAEELITDLLDLTKRASGRLELVGADNTVCQSAINSLPSYRNPEPGALFRHALRQNVLPYKTIALSYLLSAVGSSDKGAIEISEWIEGHRGVIHPWYISRAQIELGLLMRKFLPDSERNPLYHQYIQMMLPELAAMMPERNITSWSKSCSEDDYFRRLLMGSYLLTIDLYVKSSSELDRISISALNAAEDLKTADVSCFRDLPGFVGEEVYWRANFLTSRAAAAIAASYSEKVYGKTSPARQKAIRATAKDDLNEALRLLDQREAAGRGPETGGAPEEIVCEGDTRGKLVGGPNGLTDVQVQILNPSSFFPHQNQRPKSEIAKAARQIFYRPPWRETGATARALLRKISEQAD